MIHCLKPHLTPTDTDTIYEWRTNPAVAKFSPTVEISIDEHRKWIEALKKDPKRHLLFIKNGVDTIAVGRFDTIEEMAAAFSFYMVPQFIGQGFARGAFSSFLNYGFNCLDFGVVKGCVHKDNAAAIHLYKSYGFQKMNESGEFHNYYVDVVTWNKSLFPF